MKQAFEIQYKAQSVVKRAKRYTSKEMRVRYGPFRTSRGEQPSKGHRAMLAHNIRHARNAWYVGRGIPA